MSLVPYVHVELGSLADVPVGATLPLGDEQRRHLHRALRLQAGAEVVVADGEGRETPATLGVNTVVVTGPVVQHLPPPNRLHLVQALAKGRKVDDVVRSATELGVDRLTVVGSARSVVRPPADKRERLRLRWEAVARAAAEQSRRPWLPVIDGPLDLDAWLEGRESRFVGVVGHPGAERPLQAVLADVDLRPDEELLAVVGPEGGFTDDEVARLERAGLAPTSLGDFVLRTEHAGHALCAVLAFYLGRMG